MNCKNISISDALRQNLFLKLQKFPALFFGILFGSASFRLFWFNFFNSNNKLVYVQKTFAKKHHSEKDCKQHNNVFEVLVWKIVCKKNVIKCDNRKNLSYVNADSFNKVFDNLVELLVNFHTLKIIANFNKI